LGRDFNDRNNSNEEHATPGANFGLVIKGLNTDLNQRPLSAMLDDSYTQKQDERKYTAELKRKSNLSEANERDMVYIPGTTPEKSNMLPPPHPQNRFPGAFTGNKNLNLPLH
jgi:hypothetical protein